MSAMQPAWMQRIEAAVLMRAFARAFEVNPPAPATLSSFRAFTAACMEEALADEGLAGRYRARLGEEARRLGSLVRVLCGASPSRALRITRYFYRGIGIGLAGELPGELRFGPCYFAGRYTPGDCWFMSAFDEGFMCGITGIGGATLTFKCRLTEGANCCNASFVGKRDA